MAVCAQDSEVRDHAGLAKAANEKLVWLSGELGEDALCLDNRARLRLVEDAGPDRTRLGNLLKAVYLDELPQIFNVVKGDMSIVGPRPERPVFVEKFREEIPGYMQKHMVKGGITGWAQVNGWRGDTDLKKRIEHDLYYIDNWSIWLDIKIILLTLLRGLVHPHAY